MARGEKTRSHGEETRIGRGVGRPALASAENVSRWVFMLGVWGALLPAGTVQAQKEELPTGAQVLDRYVEVTGGRKAYEKLHTRIIRARFTPPNADAPAHKTMYFAEPSAFFQETHMPDGTVRREGVSGDVVWYIHPQTGPAIRDGVARERTLRFAFFHGDLHWRKLFKEAKCVGVEDVEGTPCYKVELTANNGDKETRFYAKDTGLLVASEMGTEGPVGYVGIRTVYSDYRKVDGIRLPFHRVQHFGGLAIEIVYESVRFNADIPPSRFRLPPEVAALRGAGSTKKTGS
ncbi:MAG: hypothetical protein D6788_04765 [Planctomycetota bacterium]|nr:MAG: hypothetical protein D6788_04765 [Planctomycetota bacterium]